MIVIPAERQAHLDLLAGSFEQLSNQPWPVWHEPALAFLTDLGKALMKPALAAKLPDVVTLAYWLRAANLQQLKAKASADVRVGLGLVVHICPANVPVNFAFSLAFALLAGNSSVLRLSSKPSPSTDLIVQHIQQLLATPTHEALRSRLLLLRYAHDDVITAALLAQADGRMIWGGDATIAHMRQFKTPSRSREVAFADRYSLALLSPTAVLALDDAGLARLAQQLFNDVLLLDQAACSSPQLFVWLHAAGDSPSLDLQSPAPQTLVSHAASPHTANPQTASEPSSAVAKAQQRLWPALAAVARDKSSLSAIGQMNKWVDAFDAVLTHPEIRQVHTEHGSAAGLLTRVALTRLPDAPEQLRGYFGTLIEIELPSLAPLAAVVNERYQTLCYFGVEPSQLQQWLLASQLRGIDRIVPVGNAIDMGLYWDGYDLLSSLSRVIEIR